MRRLVIILLCACGAWGQSNRRARPADPGQGAWIHGSVVSDSTDQPLLRAQVILRPMAGATNNVLVETDEHGRFVINRIVPGSYSLLAQRDGYLSNAVARRGTLRLPPVIQLSEGTHVTGITFRMRPWAVMAGKILYDDAEPAVGATVQLFHESKHRGRHSMQLVNSARVNDRGEYRIHGLAPGSYFVAATRNRPAAPDLEEQDPIDESGQPRTEFRYATTFYPAAQKLSDAVAVRLESAQEAGGIDIYLKPAPAVRIRGRVLNGVTGQPVRQPNLTFRRMTADGQSSIPVSVNLAPYEDGFEIKGITAGPYLVTCFAEYEGQRLQDSRYLLVSDSPIDNLDLVLTPDREISGSVRFDDSPPFDLKSIRVSLEPRSDLNPLRYADVAKDGAFTAKVAGGESYDLYILNAPADYYVKTLRIANLDIGADGIAGSAAGPGAPLIVTLSGKSAKVQGRAFLESGGPASGATIALVPEPAHGRGSAYQFGSADELGIFRMTGLAPGRYTVFAYYDEPPCELFDEAALSSCRTQGRDVSLAEAAQATIELRVSN